MDFESEIKKMLDDGKSWTDIADTFANTMNEVHKKSEAELSDKAKTEAIIDALSDYYDSEMDEVLLSWKWEDVKKLLDNYKEIYGVFKNTTFPFRK